MCRWVRYIKRYIPGPGNFGDRVQKCQPETYYSIEHKMPAKQGNSTGGNVLRLAQDYTLREGEWAPPALPKIREFLSPTPPPSLLRTLSAATEQSTQSSGYPLKGWTWRSTAFPPDPPSALRKGSWCEHTEKRIETTNDCRGQLLSKL